MVEILLDQINFVVINVELVIKIIKEKKQI